jgi:hypothetical protein
VYVLVQIHKNESVMKGERGEEEQVATYWRTQYAKSAMLVGGSPAFI